MEPIRGYLDDIDGARIYYEELGEGTPVVLLHTGNGNTSIWDGQFEELAQRFRVIRYDLRSYGRSSYPPGPFLLPRDLKQLMVRLGVERAHIVAPSLGGRIGVEFAVENPGMVRSLVLAAPVLRQFPWSDVVTRTRALEDEAMMAGDFDRATDLMMQSWVAGPQRTIDELDPEMIRRIRATQRMAYEVQRAALSADEKPGDEEPLDPPAEDRLGDITAPVLMILGDKDQPDALAIGEQLKAGIPNIRTVVFEGVGHMITMERPREFMKLALEHITAQEAEE